MENRLAEIVDKALKSKGLSQNQLAKLCQVSPTVISRIFQQGKASVALCEKMAEHLEVDLDLLLLTAGQHTYANLSPDEFEYVHKLRELNPFGKKLAMMNLELLQKSSSDTLLVVGEVVEEWEVNFGAMSAVKIAASDSGPLRFGLRSKITSKWMGLYPGAVLLLEASSTPNPKFPNLWRTEDNYLIRNFTLLGDDAYLESPGFETTPIADAAMLGFFIKLLQPKLA